MDTVFKNFSLLETSPEKQECILSPAYDLLPVNIILPEDNEQTALTRNGKKKNLHRNDFLVFAKTCRIHQNAAERMIDTILAKEQQYLKTCEDSFLPDDRKESLKTLIHLRIESLK